MKEKMYIIKKKIYNGLTKFFPNVSIVDTALRLHLVLNEKDILFLLFILFLLIFAITHGPITFFGTIHEPYYTISANFSFIYRTFNKKFSISAK